MTEWSEWSQNTRTCGKEKNTRQMKVRVYETYQSIISGKEIVCVMG